MLFVSFLFAICSYKLLIQVYSGNVANEEVDSDHHNTGHQRKYSLTYESVARVGASVTRTCPTLRHR